MPAEPLVLTRVSAYIERCIVELCIVSCGVALFAAVACSLVATAALMLSSWISERQGPYEVPLDSERT